MLTWATLRMRLGLLLVGLIVSVMAATPAFASLTVCASDAPIAVAVTTDAGSALGEAATVVAADSAVPRVVDSGERDRPSGAADEACQDDHCQHTAHDGNSPVGVSAPLPSVQRAFAGPGRVAADDRQFGLKRPPRG